MRRKRTLTTANPLGSQGTAPTLIKNATVWTGNDQGRELLLAHDVLLDKGLILRLGQDLETPKGAKVLQAHGAWLTPGIVDMHSHIGVDSLPSLQGSDDVNR